ncbi:MAG TPA: tetratricopeptide repeat protein, partial [Myxococcota bacterium]|nr:tetratricopeptide repeat protein [Myxococcota bacterium]
RHIPVTTLRLGPHDVNFNEEARWLGADGATSRPSNMRGLIGYEVFKNHRLVLDYPGQHLVLEDSKVHPARDFDAVAAYLQRELDLHGQAPERALVRARLQIGSDDIPGARKSVEEALQKLPDNVELRVMLARIQRYEGQIEEAITTLRDLDPKQVSDEGEWLAFINALVLSGHTEEALRRAEAALNLPEIEDYQGEFLVAVSDALLANGKLAQAAAAIDEATRISGGRNGHLLRKARIAYAEQDRYGTIVVLRRLMDIYPLNGVPMWLYALMSQPRDQETFAVDLETALARLHPGDQPWDFAGAAWQIIGQKEKAKAALEAGYARDCADLDGSERANCDAWYWSLGEQRPEEAQARIQ